MSFSEFLNWLTSADGGAFIVISWAAAWGMESFTFWKDLGAKPKALIVLGFSAVMAVLGVWFKTKPELVEAIDPYFTAISYVALAWLTTQGAHLFKNLRKPTS